MLSKFIRSCTVSLKQVRTRYKQDIYNAPKKGSAQYKKDVQVKVLHRNAKDAAEKVTKELDTKTPKVITLIVIATTLPQLHSLYEILAEDFSTNEYLHAIKRGVDWINLTTTFFAATYFGLDAVKYSDRKSTLKIPFENKRFALLLIPVAMALGSLSFSQDIERWRVMPAIVADLTMLLLEGKFTAEGLMPYWFFHLKYRLHIFTVLNLALFHYSLKHLHQDIERNPENYVKKETPAIQN